ncbi:MAG TPA: PLP-dependent aminotransferase family protein, partial [Solirubrobacteraceae bacterium]|nr:PLP-dependent aminotransferase family protein [Solirubrobacteraceae bacterium]
AAPDDVVITGGVHAGLHLVWPALRRRGARRVAVEDPGWRGQRRSVEHAGLELVPVPVDERGLRTDTLPDLDVDAVCVSPAHQYPTGVVLAPERRAALIAWADAHDGLIVEDDYDAEYRYDREAVGALQALAPQRVVYAGSASKTLAPALRLGWLAVPPHLTVHVAREAELAARAVPTLDQAAYADLLQRGEVDRHLRRTRRRYRPRRDALVQALATHLPDRPITGIAAGLHVVLELPPDADEAATVDAAAASGVLVEGLRENCLAVAPRPPALLLGYAALSEPALARAAELLAARIEG